MMTYGKPSSGASGKLPFIGRVVNVVPGDCVVIERALDLREDAYLADHTLVHAQGAKPLTACLPVMPMTMSVEAMAEVAACVAPGLGLVGVEEVKASRWIELLDTETALLKIFAKGAGRDAERDATCVSAAIYVNGAESPSITAKFLFAPNYLLELLSVFETIDEVRASRIDSSQLYAERHLFHGPAFQCLTGDILIDENRIKATLAVPVTDRLFNSNDDPQLLLQPAVLDNICQIVGVWAMESERYAFPVGLGKLELYRPTPAPGACVTARVELTRTQGKMLHADVEIQDGEGGVWMRLHDLRCWKFQSERRVINYRRAPEQFLLSQPVPIGCSASGLLALLLDEEDLGVFDPRMLARDCLSVEELQIYEHHARFHKRQRQWLLGRAVAKDCVRLWRARRYQHEMAHPAAVIIRTDASGRPFVSTLGSQSEDADVRISISHCDGRAIAIAHDAPVGIDVERVVPRDDDFIDAIASSSERALLYNLPAAERDQWVTRLWSAKEALAKRLSIGVGRQLKVFESIELSADGRISILDRQSERLYEVMTVLDQEYIISCAL